MLELERANTQTRAERANPRARPRNHAALRLPRGRAARDRPPRVMGVQRRWRQAWASANREHVDLERLEREVFRLRRGAELIGASIYELEPGDRLWPYHTHHANEEWALVVSGRPTLRTPAGEQQQQEGDIACFPRGAAGAHQVKNETDAPIRILLLSTLLMPEIVEYPDTGKVGVRNATGEQIILARSGSTAEYWEAKTTNARGPHGGTEGRTMLACASVRRRRLKRR